VSALVYLRDRFLDSSEDARVSLFDRGYLFGDSIFETLRAYAGVPFAVDAHLDRLEHAARVTGIALPRERSEIASLLQEAVRRSGCESAYVRITVSRGEGREGLATVGADDPVLSIIVRSYGGYSAEAYAHGIESVTLETRKVPAACLDPSMKTGNYLPNVLARRELERHGLIEGVVLSVDDRVVSGTVSNLFLVEAGALRTPDEASGCRPGVTRALVIELGKALGLGVVRAPIVPADFAGAEEAFFVNSLMECLPVRQLDGRALRSAEAGSITRRVHAAYQARVRS
jgi:branched-chain amino acid aminotransferase